MMHCRVIENSATQASGLGVLQLTLRLVLVNQLPGLVSKKEEIGTADAPGSGAARLRSTFVRGCWERSSYRSISMTAI